MMVRISTTVSVQVFIGLILQNGKSVSRQIVWKTRRKRGLLDFRSAEVRRITEARSPFGRFQLISDQLFTFQANRLWIRLPRVELYPAVPKPLTA